jgi:D-alanyl-D-alanine carboxypeptidase (penicillin-binding protein 5/6)
MEKPENQHRNDSRSGHEHHAHHHHASRMDQPSPMNMLWGLILIVLTFLLVVICVLSVQWIIKLSTPSDPGGDVTPPIVDPEVDPPVILPSSWGQSWSPDTPEATLTFKSDAALADFLQVTVNDTVLDTVNYTLSEGSTVVTLKADYLAQLAAGTYTIGIHSKNGVASTTFEIKVATSIDPGPGQGPGPEKPPKDSFLMHKDSNTVTMESKENSELGVYSKYAILVDLESNRIAAELNADIRIYPASMTKALTLLVACERLTEAQLNEYITFSPDVIADMQRQNASGFGFEAGEELRVVDLLYAIALESDCAASVQLAIYVAGSHEAFVQMMNDKCAELELFNTHMVNATGLHDPNHYTTCREMASIMAAAVANEQVKALLSAEKHVTTTNVHGKVTFYSTYFADLKNAVSPFAYVSSNATDIAAKTGMTDEAGYCLATYMKSKATGKSYIIITASASSQYLYAQDNIYIFDKYAQ